MIGKVFVDLSSIRKGSESHLVSWKTGIYILKNLYRSNKHFNLFYSILFMFAPCLFQGNRNKSRNILSRIT